MTTIKDITLIPSDKIRIIPANSKERKLIHEWMSTKYPDSYKAGLKSKLFPEGSYRVYKRCYNCDYKNVSINTYHYGVLENNQDEWRSGTCPRCDEQITHECNYDDGAIYVPGRNIMAFGDYFKTYQKYSVGEVEISDEEISNMLANKKVYEIDVPKSLLNRKSLEKYINNHLTIE